MKTGEVSYKWPKSCPISAQGWSYLQRKYHFTSRELQLVICICHGCDIKMTAQKLEIAVNTAKAHLANVYQKVGVNNKVTLLLTFISDVKKDLN
ncbi:MAG: helix-turn-helix transcriptional regulator [Sedimentisphaerales bacterium]|nr:helix-turn-helix transcriptional regulator [Sedimentisphaerales bacterium]